MASRSEMVKALQIILDNLCNSSITDEEIKAIEEKNAQLRQLKNDIMAQINARLTSSAFRQRDLLKDMLLRAKISTQARSEAKKLADIKYRNRSQEIAEEIASWRDKIQGLNTSFMTLPYHEVQEKILEMEKKIAANKVRIDELKKEEALVAILKPIEEEQRELTEKLKSRIDKV